jgi:hypothetical protein
MALINGTIPNMINGVSQQPPSLRLRTQAQLQENALSSVVSGLLKRPATEHIAELTTLTGKNVDNGFIHTSRRDAETLNSLVITNENGTPNLQLLDKDGTDLTVTGDLSYLASATSPMDDLAAVTIADVTYIVNKKVPVQIHPDTTPLQAANRRYECLVYVKQGDYRTTYTLSLRTVGGTWVNKSYETGYSTNDSTSATNAAEASVKTDNIATQLSAIVPPTGISITRYNNVLHIYSATDFEVGVADSRGNNHLLAFKEETMDFKKLPPDGVNGFTIKITGDNAKGQDDYWVKLSTGTVGQGVWKETVAPDITYKFDDTTMPHQLKRTGTNTYVFEPMPWAERKCGDDDTNPFPIFAEDNLPINDIFFHSNRLGMLYDENIILSETGEFENYNLFRKTVLTTLDTDPIDVAVSNNQVSILRHAVPFAESLLLFSDQTQFKLSSQEYLAPDTVTIDVSTQFEASLKAKPVGAGKYVFFPVQRGKWAGLREYYVDTENDTNDSADVTAHIPKYIEGNITKLEASSNEDTILAITDAQPNTIYVYRYYWQNKEKLQASWSRWTFTGEVLNVAFDKSEIRLLMKYPDGKICLEKMTFSTDDSTEETIGNFPVLLDRRQKVTLDAGSNNTAYNATITSDLPDNIFVTNTGAKISAHKVVQNLLDGNIVYSGIPYTMRYIFSEQVIRSNDETINVGRLQIRNMNVVYNDTGYFKAEVRPNGSFNQNNRKSFATQFSGRVVGSITNLLNVPAISKGTFRITVMANSENLEVELSSDSYMPCAFQSAEWEGYYNVRSQRV